MVKIEALKEVFIYLRELNTASLIIRLMLAVICGGVIGIDREIKNHAAGLRTHILVCIGAASVMMVNEYIYIYNQGTADISRMGAQVISGIGFLGAGTIITTGRRQVKGLTTAAGLWASACMGLAIGIGFYECAVIMCIFLFSVLQWLNRLEDKFKRTRSHVDLYLEHSNNFKLSSVLGVLVKSGWHVENINSIYKGSDGGSIHLTAVKVSSGEDIEEIIHGLRLEEGVFFIESI